MEDWKDLCPTGINSPPFQIQWSESQGMVRAKRTIDTEWSMARSSAGQALSKGMDLLAIGQKDRQGIM